MALDQGTTSSRALIFDHSGNTVATAQKELRMIYPQPGWVEQDPMDIWATQSGVMSEAMARAGIAPEQLAGIGMANQRETTIVWDRHSGQPVYNALVWQSRQSADICDQLREISGYPEILRSRSGLLIDAYFSGSKIRWILDHVEGAQERAEAGDLLFGTVDTWLLWKLSEGRCHATDYSNASRSMLFNIHTLEWDRDLLEALNIPSSMLPEVQPSSHCFTEISLGKASVPVAGIAGDQQSALFGQACFAPGMAKNTYGTGAFLLLNTGTTAAEPPPGLLSTIAWGLDGQVHYALEGSVFMAGAAIQWLRDDLGLLRDAADSAYFASKEADSNGVYVVPAFTGLGAPYWDSNARGIICGLSRGVNRNHIIRATLESIAYQSSDVLECMLSGAQLELSHLRVDGGAAANDLLLQFQADLLDCIVQRPAHIETTALGAAWLAGLATGFWSGLDELSNQWKLEQSFSPEMDSGERQTLQNGWKDAVNRCRS